MYYVTTTDISKFGFREWELLKDILVSMCDRRVPGDFDDSWIEPLLNVNSGEVFLRNAKGQLAMMNGDKLELFYCCPECDYQGFMEDMEATEAGFGAKECCKEYVSNL